MAGTDSASISQLELWDEGVVVVSRHLYTIFMIMRASTRHTGIFHNIFGSGSLIGLYIMQTDANNAVMGLQPVEWQDPVRDSAPKMNLNLIWWRRWRARDASTPSS